MRISELWFPSLASCVELTRRIEADIGPVDILVNNAGITRDASLKKMTPENWSTVINADLSGVFNMTKQVFEKMLLRGSGRVINISSVNGQRGQFGQANYSAAKAGYITGTDLSVNGGLHMY